MAGVKGMKWGVIRARGKNGRVSDHADFTTSRVQKKTPKRQLSTKELEQLNKRLQLEKTYKELTAAGATRKIQRTNTAINTVLALGVTANAAIAFANSPAGKATVNAIKNAVGK